MKKRLLIAISLCFVVAGGLFWRAQQPARADDTRVVTVFVDNQERTIASNGATVGAVLANQDIVVGDHDKTEPKLEEPVKGSSFTINVYRARPITVVDGANHYTVMTAERSPRQIAEDAGFSTKQEDQFSFQRSDDPFAGAPGTQMVIKRAKTITLDLYGTANSLNTNEISVGGLLSERGIKLDPADELSVSLGARIDEGMVISIVRIGKQLETVEEPVVFPEEQIKDAQQPVGYKKVQSPGSNGKKLVTYELVSRNGAEPVKTPIEEVITQQPVKQVVVVGAKLAVNVGGNCGEWLAQAGITDPDAIWLIGKESGCNPGAVNRSSGACGIPQALPCSKLKCPLDASGAVCQLNWMENYVAGRYGSWANARAFHASRGWY
jgi:uncharacterized protein YabE (DUF348 family)